MKKNKNEMKVLLSIESKLQAEEIQLILKENGIPSLIQSDHPASSAMNAFAGPNVFEDISVFVNEADYEKSVEIVKNTSLYPYTKGL